MQITPRLTHRRAIRFAALAMAVLTAAGCRDTAPTGPAPGAATPAAFDIEAIMEGLAATLRDETVIMKRALDDWGSIGESDHRAFAALLAERKQLGADFEAMLRSQPTWGGRACEWFASVVQTPHIETVRLRNRLFEAKVDAEGTRSRYAQLLRDALGSADAARAHLTWRTDHPGSPENVYLFCVKFGHIEE